jgi:hypothetical protein
MSFSEHPTPARLTSAANTRSIRTRRAARFLSVEDFLVPPGLPRHFGELPFLSCRVTSGDAWPASHQPYGSPFLPAWIEHDRGTRWL